MSLSTNGPPADGIVYLTLPVSASNGTVELQQGSGVLVSPDTVLTANHVVYDDGTQLTSGTAVVGKAGSNPQTIAIAGVSAGPPSADATLAQISSDFALVKLAQPVTDGTIFSLGADNPSGTFTVAGFPAGTGGQLDSKDEPLALFAGSNVYSGGTLDEGSNDPHGSSGGTVYQTVAGHPTAFGVISGEDANDPSQGAFVELTGADIATIDGWIAAYDAGSSPAATPSTASSAGSTPGIGLDSASFIGQDALARSGAQLINMSDVASAIRAAATEGPANGWSYDREIAYADTFLHQATFPRRAMAYFAGFLAGANGASPEDVPAAANAILQDAVHDRMTKGIAEAGAGEARKLGFTTTANAIDPTSASLAAAIAPPAGFDPSPTSPHAALWLTKPHA